MLLKQSKQKNLHVWIESFYKNSKQKNLHAVRNPILASEKEFRDSDDQSFRRELFSLREEPSACRILGGDNHPVWYTILYTIFYKTHDKRGYSSHSTQLFDLYTYQNANNPHSVDNTVDNVDNTLWITHTVFVNKWHAWLPFTHGNPRFFVDFLQDGLQNRS